MSLTADHATLGPIRWIWRPHAHGIPAETEVRRWLAGLLGIAPETLALHRDAHGRPRLETPDVDLSWSHSGDGLLIALGTGVEVGIDLERLRPRPRALDLAQRYFTAAENTWLLTHADSVRELAFVRLWCAKESVLKAHGRGIAFGLDKLEFEERDGTLHLHSCDPALGLPAQWQLHEFAPQPGYRAALAWRTA